MSTEDSRFPCDQCGADMRFDPGQDRLICDFCGHVQALSVDKSARNQAIRELDYQAAVANQLPATDMETTRVSHCNNCGADVEFEGATHAAECPFCAAPVVTDTGEHRHIKPRALLGFGIDENAARDAMNAWLKRLWFAPSGLHDYARKGRKMNGIYVPYWTYDADTKSRYSGERGDHYYETRTVVRDGKRETERVRRTRWTNASGRVGRFFDDVLVLGSRSLPKKYTDRLKPWDLTKLEPYSPDYLAGFRAEGYQVQLDEGFVEARDYMDRIIRQDIKRDIGGDEQRISHVDTTVRDVTFKHILLPVWLAAYKYRGKTYRFVVNGQTGKVQGERPYSAIKIAIAVVLGLIVAGGVAYFASQTQ